MGEDVQVAAFLMAVEINRLNSDNVALRGTVVDYEKRLANQSGYEQRIATLQAELDRINS